MIANTAPVWLTSAHTAPNHVNSSFAFLGAPASLPASLNTHALAGRDAGAPRNDNLRVLSSVDSLSRLVRVAVRPARLRRIPYNPRKAGRAHVRRRRKIPSHICRADAQRAGLRRNIFRHAQVDG